MEKEETRSAMYVQPKRPRAEGVRDEGCGQRLYSRRVHVTVDLLDNSSRWEGCP